MKKFYLQFIAGLTGVGVVYLIFALFQMQFDASKWHGLVQLAGVMLLFLSFAAIFDSTEDRF